MANKSLSQKGSAHIVIIIILVVALLGVLGFVFWQNFIDKKPVTKNDESSKNENTQNQPTDEYEGWKTYTSTRDGYSIKYPSDWLAINEVDNDGPYIRNFDPSSRPPEDAANHKNYPKDYINLRVLKIEGDDANFMGSTATEWYAKLGVTKTPGMAPPYIHDPSTVSDITINNMPAKKSKTVFTETTEDIFLLKNGSLYHISLYPYGASGDETVKKILDSFSYS